jgi:DNA-binding CsgD family transcriptional regulator
LAQFLIPSRSTAFRLFPWLLFLTIIACLLGALGPPANFVGFLSALAVSSVFEVLFIVYMARLTLSGYIPAALAFGLSAATIRLGICLGNAWALTYEHVPGLLETWTAPTLLVFAAILAGLLIPLVRQEYMINDLTRSPQDSSEWDKIVVCTAHEFRLSTREQEVVGLLGRGYSATAIADKLVISPHTVNSHVQHIYAKMGIHKRSELLDHLNNR